MKHQEAAMEGSERKEMYELITFKDFYQDHVFESGRQESDVAVANGDMVDGGIVFRSKEEAVNYLIEDVVSSINHEKIVLANSQYCIREQERMLKVLEKQK